LGERDKIEPFWARVSRARRSGPPPLIVPERHAEAPQAPEPSAPPSEEPREPSFKVSHEARRAAIADMMADAGARGAGPAAPIPAATEPGARQEPSLGPAPTEETEAPDAQGWIALTRAQAAQHPLYGVGGWLVVLAFFVALGLAMGIVEVFDFWATTDHGGLSAWIMAGLRSFMVLWAALIFVLLLTASRAFPTAFVAYTIFYIIYLGLFGLAFAYVTHGAVFRGVAAAIPLHLLAIAYVLRSRRVNVTFRRRVRAKKRAETPPPDAGAEASPA
jgi:hypothetical protein